MPLKALLLLLEQESWTLQQNCTHTLILTRHPVISTIRKKQAEKYEEK